MFYVFQNEANMMGNASKVLNCFFSHQILIQTQVVISMSIKILFVYVQLQQFDLRIFDLSLLSGPV